MQERRLIKQLKQHDPDALSELMQQYTAYVGTIVRNILGKVLTESDVEEVTADVFVIVWNHSKEIQQGKLRPYLATVARNCAKNRLRGYQETVG